MSETPQHGVVRARLGEGPVDHVDGAQQAQHVTHLRLDIRRVGRNLGLEENIGTAGGIRARRQDLQRQGLGTKPAHRDRGHLEQAFALRRQLDMPKSHRRLATLDELHLRVDGRVKNLEVGFEGTQVRVESARSPCQLEHQAHALAGVNGIALEARRQLRGARSGGAREQQQREQQADGARPRDHQALRLNHLSHSDSSASRSTLATRA